MCIPIALSRVRFLSPEHDMEVLEVPVVGNLLSEL
jgi:hypothetical protein